MFHPQWVSRPPGEATAPLSRGARVWPHLSLFTVFYLARLFGEAADYATITHDHADRVRSYELLAAEWQRR